MMVMDAMVEAAADAIRKVWGSETPDGKFIDEAARSAILAALAAGPVGEEVERVAGWLDDEYSHAAAAGASLLRSLSASLAAVTAERDEAKHDASFMRAALGEVAHMLKTAEAERDEALHQVEELERNAEKVADEFERDCWKALRSLLAECHFEWDADAQLEGVSAEEAREHISTTLAECDRAAERFKAERDAAVAKSRGFADVALRNGEALLKAEAERDEAIRQRDQAVEALARLHERYVLVVGNEGPEAMEARRIVTLAAIRKEPTDAKGGEHG
jgi:hypothetical protein